MWLVINIIVLVIGICMLCYGKYIDSSENTEALMWFIFGVIFILCSGISHMLRWLFS